MLLPEDSTAHVVPLGNRFDFLSTLCEGYYTFSPHVVSNMCGFEERMTERKQAVSFPDDFSSYSSPYFQQPVPESPRTGEIPPQSPSHLSDSGRPTPAKPQYTTELDVLCRICGDRASGFHYGVHSCEGCKGFFRRTLKKKLKYRPCQMGSRCKIDQTSRNKCQYCRYQRCLNAGMSQDAVRFGRMPKTEREKLMADKEELCSTDSKRIVELRSLTDLITAAFRDVFQETIFFKNATQQTAQEFPKVENIYSPFDDTNELTSEQFFAHDIFSAYQDAIVPVMESGVKFAKKLPNFPSLLMCDQISLMKTNGFLIVPISLLYMIDRKNINLGTLTSRIRLPRSISVMCNEVRVLLERTILIIDRLASFDLQTGEIALFASIVLTQECYGLVNPHQVEELQLTLVDALRLDLKHNHPKERLLLPKLLVLMADLYQVMDEFSKSLKGGLFDRSPDYRSVKPLLKEIFDLC